MAKETYTIEEIAKFYAVTVMYATAYMLPGNGLTLSDMRIFHAKILQDLRADSIEKACAEFDKQLMTNKN